MDAIISDNGAPHQTGPIIFCTSFRSMVCQLCFSCCFWCDFVLIRVRFPPSIFPSYQGQCPESFSMQAEQIKALIESQIPDSQVQVGVNGNHIDLVVVSPVFAGLTPVKKQQLVLGTLSQQFADGSIHAVDFIKTFTPEQWQQQ